MKLLPLLLLIVCTACSEAERGKLATFGSSARVTCYSGGVLIFDAVSTGKVSNETNSDGYFAKYRYVAPDGTPTSEEFYASVSGDCTILYKEDQINAQ